MTIQKSEPLGGLDIFKLVAAYLVVAIHTSPLSSINSTTDFLLTRVIARMAVPFFLMVSGYFVLPRYLFDRSADYRPVRRFLKKGLLLYAAASLLYLPVKLYAGHLENMGIYDVFRTLVFDGTFYHLWYLPASLLGMLMLCLLSRRLSFPAVFGISLLLYGIGLFGDSYYGLIADCPVIGEFYDMLFQIFTYTRNGVFYVPVFLAVGAYAAHKRQQAKTAALLTGFILSAVSMIAEGLLLHSCGLQRHDSMYLFLLPCMQFLFALVLQIQARPSRQLRSVSTGIYILHPLVIVLVRGCAKVIHLEGLLIENSLIHYAAVCVGSTVISIGLVKGAEMLRKLKGL